VRPEELPPAPTLGLTPTAVPATLGILEMAKPAPPSTIAPLEPRIARVMPPAATQDLKRTIAPATLDSTGLVMRALTAMSALGNVVAIIAMPLPPAATPLEASLVPVILDSMETE